MRKRCILSLFLILLLLNTSAMAADWTERNDETGFLVVIDDSAKLLSASDYAEIEEKSIQILH